MVDSLGPAPRMGSEINQRWEIKFNPLPLRPVGGASGTEGEGVRSFKPIAVGANNYEDNLCETSTFVPASPTNVCEIPNIAGHKNPGEDD
jgi:hypothetical protein